MLLNKQQKRDSKKCDDMDMNGESMDCVECSCSVCIAQIKPTFDKKELATIMSTLIDATISRKYEVENKTYCCEEELKSLETQIDVLNKLTAKVSKIINS